MLKYMIATVAVLGALGTNPVMADTAPWVATSEGVGPLKIGMSVAQVEAALNAKIVLSSDESGDPVACSTATVPDQKGLWLMFQHYQLASVTFQAPSPIKTAGGIGIGASEAQLHAVYKKLDETLRDYAEPGDPQRQMTFWTVKNERGIRFLTDKTKRIDMYRIGDKSITYMEGCL